MTTKEEVLNQIENINKIIEENLEITLTDEGKKYFLRLLKKHSYEDIVQTINICINNYYVLGDDETRDEVLKNIEGVLYNVEFQKEKPELADINYLLKIAKNKFDLRGLYYKNIKEILMNNYTNDEFQDIKDIFCNYSGYTPLKNQLELYYGKE